MSNHVHTKKKWGLKSLCSLLLSKIVIVSLLIILQMAFLLAVILLLGDHFVWIYSILMLLSIAIVVWLVNKNENPAYKLAWVIPLLSFPLFGGLFYLMFGNKGMPQKLARRVRAAEKGAHRVCQPGGPLVQELESLDSRCAAISNYITRTTGAPLWNRTSSEYFPLGEDMWQRMLEELAKAEKFIFMEYFILDEGKMWESIFRILEEKAAAGVEVRFMYDDMGSIFTLPPNYGEKLRAAGIQCTVFNPYQPHLNSMMNYRDHRKITVIDGNVGFCGGINIADEYINAYEKYGHWKDTGVMLKGDGVWNLTAMFLSLWNFSRQADVDPVSFRPTRFWESDGFVQPFGDSPLDRVNVCEDVYMQIINRATRYVYMTTPYLILDNEMVTALQTAARSGIDVRILVPHLPDKWFVHQTTQSFYQQLLDTGVRIYEYTPGFVHAKMYVSDDEIAVVGTANMDYRSFYLHFECAVAFYHARLVADVREDILRTLEQSFEIPKDYSRHVKLWKRIVRAFLRLFSPMM